MKRLCFLLAVLLLAPAGAGAECTVKTLDSGDVVRLVMENELVRVTLDPARGGVISSLYDKTTNTEFAGEIPGGNVGIAEDLTWRPDVRSWFLSPYKYHVLSRGGDEAAVRLWRRPGGGYYGFVTISKTVRLKRGSAAVRVDYRISNAPESMGAIEFPLWLHNLIVVKGKKARYYLPTINGVESHPYEPGRQGNDVWVYEPARGWSGMVTEDGTGLAATMDFTRLHALYDCFGSLLPSIEWRYIPVTIQAGKDYRTSVGFTPFSGLRRLDHATAEMACEIAIKDKFKVGEPLAGKLRIAAAADLSAEVYPRLRLAPSRQWRTLKRRKIRVKAGRVATFPFRFDGLDKKALAVVGFIVRAGNRELANFERLVIVGDRPFSKTDYTYAPLRQRVRTGKHRDFIPFTPRDNIVTDHVNWYKPYSRSRPKTLFVISWEGLRSVLELAQRASIDAVTVTSRHGAPGHKDCRMGWYPPASSTVPYYIDSSLYYKNLDAPFTDNYDVIVISNSQRGSSRIQWKYFTKYTASRLREMVKAGTGLVVVHPLGLTPEWEKLHKNARKVTGPQKDLLQAGIPFERIPLFGPEDIRVAQLGKGRVVFLEYNAGGMIPYLGGTPEPSYPYYEYCYLALARAIYWAARREPELSLKSLAVEPQPVPQEKTAKLVAHLAPSRAMRGVTAEVTVSDRDGKDVHRETHKVDLSARPSTVAFELPTLPGGPLIARVRFLSNGKVLTSAAAAFEVVSPFSVESVTLDPQAAAPGDTLRGKVTCKSADPTAERTLKIEIIDTWDRVWWKELRSLKFKAGEARVDFQAKISNPLSPLHRVRCTIMLRETPLSARSAEFTVPSVTDTWDDFDANYWMCSDDQPPFIKRLRMNRMRELGFRTVFKVVSSGELKFLDKNKRAERAEALGATIDAFVKPIVASNMRVIVSGMWSGARDWNYATNRHKEHPVRRPCLSDQAYLDAWRYQAQVYEKYGWRWGIMRYVTADETSLGHYISSYDLCWSPLTLREFRGWLKKLYGSLEALNAEWETSFARWEDVSPMTEAEARGRANLAPWLDFRTFMDDVFTRALLIGRKAVCRRNKHVGFGASGTSPSHPYNGHDWFKLMKAYNAVNTYRDTLIYQSFAPGARFSSWTGYRKPPVQEWNLVWRWVLMGQAGWAIWTDDFFVLPDLNFTEHYAPTAKAILDKFTKGLGKQLAFVCERPDDGVAVHWSKASLTAAYMQKYRENNSRFLRKIYNRLAGIFEPGDYPCLLADMGFEFRYLASPQVEAGELNSGKWKVLLLPMAMALSDREAEEIGKFVRAGGVLVADCLAGVYDEHGKPRKTGALDDLFGIRRLQKGKRLAFEARPIAGTKDKVAIYERGIVPAGGTPLARLATPSFRVGDFLVTETAAGKGAPIAIANHVGRGRAVYLGFVGDYHSKRAKGRSLLALYEKWLDLGHLKPPIRLTDPDGEPVPAQISRFNAGNARFAAFFRDAEYYLPEYKVAGEFDPGKIGELQRRRACAAKARLPEPFHVYDVNRGKYLGRVRAFDVELVPGRAELMALLPYEVKRISVRVPAKAQPGETISFKVTLEAGGDEVGEHVVHFAVHGPDGNELSFYSRNVVLEKGVFEGELPVAYNALPGAYRISVRDVPTGKSAEASFVVK